MSHRHKFVIPMVKEKEEEEEVKKVKPCPECGRKFTMRWFNRHLIKEHGYLYNEAEIPVKEKE